MELKNLQSFLLVAEHLNMSKAAKILNYTQPTITLQIKVLERELNHTLFTRIGNKLFLTPAGEKVKKYAEKLFVVLENLESELEELNGPAGKLSISASEYYCTHHLSLLLNSYTTLHPQVQLKLVPANSQIAIENVLNNEADIGIIACDCDSPYIEKHILDKEQMILVVATEIFNNNSKEEIFSKYPFLAYHGQCNFDGIIEKCFSELNYKPVSVIECGGSDETIRRATLNQTGIALLGENVIKEELANGQLIPLHYCDHYIETSFICLKARSENPTIQSFYNLLKEVWHDVAG